MSEKIWNAQPIPLEHALEAFADGPSPGELRSQKVAELRARERLDQRLAITGAVVRVTVVAALLAALYWWPYATECGIGLAAFLAAQGMIVIGGAWAAVFSWRQRFATSHTIALVLVLAGLVLVSAQVLPRTGYVRIAGVHASGWRCVAQPHAG